MALVRVKEILKAADEHNTAVLAFDCCDYNMVYPVIHVAHEMGKPVIVMLHPDQHRVDNLTDLGCFAAMVRKLAESVNVPVGLHLDHCSDYDYIITAIREGFSSVMIDGSMLPMEENIAISSKVAETAHILNADVEAELGHVGLAANRDGETNDMFTQPDAAAEFCERTGVDSIAVAIGSAHGVYIKEPKLDLKRLEEINLATNTPLVLHGGSGIPDEQMRLAFTMGINKLNVGTEYFQLYSDSIYHYMQKEGTGGKMLGLGHYTQDILMDYLREKMKLCKF